MGNPTRILGGSGHPAFYWALNEMAETHDRKNQDYANPTDPFANFRACEKAGISMVDGIYTRMSDKWERITNLIAKQRQDVQPAVVGESLADTLIDLANYAIILRIALDEQGKSEEPIHQFCTGDTHSVACPATKREPHPFDCVSESEPQGATLLNMREYVPFAVEEEPAGITTGMDAFRRTTRAIPGVPNNEPYRG